MSKGHLQITTEPPVEKRVTTLEGKMINVETQLTHTVTKTDLATAVSDINDRIQKSIQGLRVEFKEETDKLRVEFKEELREEIGKLRAELKEDIRQLHIKIDNLATEMRNSNKELREYVDKRSQEMYRNLMIGAGVMATIIGVIVAIISSMIPIMFEMMKAAS